MAVSAQQQPPKQTTAKERQPSTAPKPKRQRVVSTLAGFELMDAGKAQRQTMAAGATRSLPRPVALGPRLGKAYGLNPVFAWRMQGKGHAFVLILTDANQAELFRRDVQGTQYQYPADAPPLEPGKTYYWTVEVEGTLLSGGPSIPAGFVVVSPEEREKIEASLARISVTDNYARELVRARVFIDYRLWYDAVAACTQLIASFPDLAAPYELRGQIYAQLPATKALSTDDFHRADKLTASSKPSK